MLVQGCCSWGYFSPNDFLEESGRLPGGKNRSNLDRFFSKINREDFSLPREPRGEWLENPEAIAEVCREYELIHCTDPCKRLIWLQCTGIDLSAL